MDTGKVRIVYRDFPIDEIHPEATISAIAANCAGDQGKYFEFHDKVFREQDRRGRDVVRFKMAELKRWASEIGRCRHVQRVRRRGAAQRRGGEGTTTTAAALASAARHSSLSTAASSLVRSRSAIFGE